MEYLLLFSFEYSQIPKISISMYWTTQKRYKNVFLVLTTSYWHSPDINTLTL